ncbi:uncharacterized protein LOC142182739 [Leptodactylus fuscus]|uniref:uncharacterized protein LOC142182739 n=1 Tax=Leptodactylus fuscus TaxID=238119 RepID=UPI003F4F08D8
MSLKKDIKDIKRFRDMVERNEYKCTSNLSNMDKIALEQFIKDNNLIIKPADKGGAIVVMDKSSYTNEIRRQLSDTEVYTILDGNPVNKIANRINNTLHKYLHDRTIDPYTVNYLTKRDPITPMLSPKCLSGDSGKDEDNRGDFWTPWVIERTLHNTSWEHAHLFIEGNNHTCKEIPGNIECEKEPQLCGNRDFGYCGALGKQPSWCMLKNVSSFVDLVHKLITQHSAFFALPPQMYWACGNNAYKWLPVGVKGTCTIVRLTPATFVVDKLNARAIPKYTLYKRAADNTPRKSGRPHLVQMSTGNKIVSTVLVYPMIKQTWDKLVEATDYLDDQIWGILGVLNTTIAVQNQLIIVTNQHTLVLDYVTAAQGGMCQVVGPTCCHYIDPEGNIKGKQELENIYKLREEYEKEVGKNEDSWWFDTFSFLNPVNWFKGIGGWITGILQIIVQIAMVILFIYCFFKLILICFNRCYDKDRYKW